MKILIFILGLIIGGGVVGLLTGNIDLLSSNKNGTVVLKDSMEFMEDKNKVFMLPKGTKLQFISQYDDVGEFTLNLVITDLSLVEKTNDKWLYFSE